MARLTTRERKDCNLPVNVVKCRTCPFRKGSKTAFLHENRVEVALSEGTPICHSTGSNNAFHARTGKAPRLCRGARDEQLSLFVALGFITEATDAAWDAKRRELGV